MELRAAAAATWICILYVYEMNASHFYIWYPQGVASNLLFAHQLKNNGGRIRVQNFVFLRLVFPQEYRLSYTIIINSLSGQRSLLDTEKKIADGGALERIK